MNMGQADATFWWYVVRAVDESGNTETNVLSVEEPHIIVNLPPVADAGVDQSGANPYFCTFNGAGSSDPDGSITSYTWTFTYNAALQTLTGVSPTFNFAISGSYTVTLTVADNFTPAATDTDQMTVTVNTPPNANAGVDQSGYIDFLVTFNGAASTDADGSIVSYSWTFTYNALPQTRTGVNPTFNFQIADVYTVTLTVTDNLGATDTDTMQVTASYLTHNIALAAGWNMISFAVNTEGGKPLATVFADEWSNIQAIMYYDPLTGDWKQYDKTAPAYMNDLKTADETKGYWVKAAAASTLTVTGKALTTTTITLRGGWNLVGVPDQHSVVASTALAGTGADVLAKFSAATTYKIDVMLASELMVPGNAYWVHVPSATSYVVTY
jgi:PKD repeat protein